MTLTSRELGMDRAMARRDFLNGVAVAVAGTVAGRVFGGGPALAQTRTYPPSLMGLRGNYSDAVAAFSAMDRGVYRQFPSIDVETREEYDLVIVGGGISGLAAAYFWRKALGPSERVLILDNHDDFGGHAKRNEFQYNGRTFIGYGG